MHKLPKLLRIFVMQMFDSFPEDICKPALAIPAALVMEGFAQHVAYHLLKVCRLYCIEGAPSTSSQQA